MDQGDHTRQHVDEGGVVNQYGKFTRRASVCRVAACGRPVRVGNLCAAHYSRLLRWGDVTEDVPVDVGAARAFRRGTGV